jgi:hypothetical protein
MTSFPARKKNHSVGLVRAGMRIEALEHERTIPDFLRTPAAAPVSVSECFSNAKACGFSAVAWICGGVSSASSRAVAQSTS